MNYTDICQKITDKVPFSFSRWGDGEWSCLLGGLGENCDKHKYSYSLGERLRQVLYEHPKYELGMQPKALKDLGASISEFIRSAGLDELKWSDADIIHNASIDGKLDKMIDAILGSGTSCMLVGAPHLEGWFYQRFMGMKSKFDGICHHYFTPIPNPNCWVMYESIKQRIFQEADTDRKMIILYCASMMSNVLIDDMYNLFGSTITQIDCGSVFDPYANGIATRRYHKDIIKREKFKAV